MRPDTELTPISRNIGNDQLVDEMVFQLPTLKRVEVPLVVIVRFREGKLAHKHIYWDQASVLVQLGLLEAGTLPLSGLERAQSLEPHPPIEHLIRHANLRA